MFRIPKRKSLTAVFISCLLPGFVIAGSPALAEDVLGVWCFKPEPDNRIYNQVITIKETDYGTYEAHIKMLFGFPEVFNLNKANGNNFEVFGGLKKEGYRLTGDGNLEFYNMFETVGVAIKIPEGQDQQDCFN